MMNLLSTMRIMKKIHTLNDTEAHILIFQLYKLLQDKNMITETLLEKSIQNIKTKIKTTPPQKENQT